MIYIYIHRYNCIYIYVHVYIYILIYRYRQTQNHRLAHMQTYANMYIHSRYTRTPTHIGCFARSEPHLQAFPSRQQRPYVVFPSRHFIAV